MLPIGRKQIDEAVNAAILSREQAERLWAFLAERAGAERPHPGRGPRFTLTNVLYYLGGLLAIGAMSIFMTLGFDRFGGGGVFFIALLYVGVALWLARWFERRALAIPAGIMAALAVVLVPLATWGAQHALGLWTDSTGSTGGIRGYRAYHAFIDWRWVTLEVATLAAAAGVLWRWRTPFLLMPVAVTLWYMSMDLAMLFLSPQSAPWSPSEWTFRQWFSLAFGLLMLLVAFWVDPRSRLTGDYAFWLYLFGLLTFWGALTSMGSGRIAGKLVYLAINAALVFVGAVLVRRTFTVFGAIGIAIVLGDISWHYFKDSWLFPLALSAIGLGIVFAGVWWSRNESRVGARLQAWLPADLRELIATRRSTLA